MNPVFLEAPKSISHCVPRQKSLCLAEAAQSKHKIYAANNIVSGSAAAMNLYKKAIYKERLKKPSLAAL